MGRPIKKKFFGDLVTAGQQIQVTYRTGGVNYTGYIVRARGERKFLVTDGTHPAVCLLVGATPANDGEMTLKVFPYGSGQSGSGATGAARFTANAVTSIGTSGTGGSYDINDQLTLSGATGTSTVFSVTSVKARTAVLASGAGTAGWTTGDTVTITNAGGTDTVIVVTAAAGAVTGVQSISNAGIRFTAIPANPVSPSSHSGPGTGTPTFTFTWGVNGVTILTAGAMTVTPANPAATATTSATGTGATLNITSYGVGSVVMSANGQDYLGAYVTFGGGSPATGNPIIVAGSITGATILTPGTYAPAAALPSVLFAPSGTGATEYARKLTTNFVYTYTADDKYKWYVQTTYPLQPGEALLETA